MKWKSQHHKSKNENNKVAFFLELFGGGAKLNSQAQPTETTPTERKPCLWNPLLCSPSTTATLQFILGVHADSICPETIELDDSSLAQSMFSK